MVQATEVRTEGEVALPLRFVLTELFDASFPTTPHISWLQRRWGQKFDLQLHFSLPCSPLLLTRRNLRAGTILMMFAFARRNLYAG